MMQNILGTEVNEFVTNRQNSKIQFLQAENAQLQEDIKDLEQALRLNKEALKISYDQRRFQSSNHSNHSTTIGQSSLAIDTEAQSKLFEKLYAENKQLFDSLQRVSRERNQAQTKVLIQEQVNEEAVAFQKDIIQELEEKILELRRIIHDKEYAIQELEKMKPIQNKDLAIKIREIITPNEQSIKMHSEIENHKYMIKKISLENQKLRQCNEKIKAFNRIIKRDVIKIKVAIKNPINYNKMKEFIFNDRLDHGDEDLLVNKEFIKEFYQEKDEWMEQQNLHQQQLQYNRNYYQNPNIKSKAQLIEDLSRLQMTVRNFKLIFHRETQSNQLLLKQIDELQAFNTQLCETNQTLIDSQKPTQDRMEKMKQEVDYYKQYYSKYMDKIRNRRRNNSSVTLDAPPLSQPPPNRPSRHAPSLSMPQNLVPNSPRQQNPMITEVMEHEEMTARGGGLGRADRRDFYTPLTPTGSSNNFQPLVSPSYAQQQQQRVLFFMQQKNNNNMVPTGGDMTSINAVSAIANINNVSSNNNQQGGAGVQQQDYDFGYAYPNTARPFMNANLNNSHNNMSSANLHLQDFANEQESSFDDGDPKEEMSLTQCKAFLINLAKDFYENSNVKANQKQFGLTKQLKDRWQQQQQQSQQVNNMNNARITANCITRAKRSLSDPLVYIFQEDLKLKQQLEDERLRKQETDHLRLFSVDMSIIGSASSSNNPSQGIRSGKQKRRNSKLITNTLASKKNAQQQQQQLPLSQHPQQQLTNFNVLDPNASFISTENDINF